MLRTKKQYNRRRGNQDDLSIILGLGAMRNRIGNPTPRPRPSVSVVPKVPPNSGWGIVTSRRVSRDWVNYFDQPAGLHIPPELFCGRPMEETMRPEPEPEQQKPPPVDSVTPDPDFWKWKLELEPAKVQAVQQTARLAATKNENRFIYSSWLFRNSASVECAQTTTGLSIMEMFDICTKPGNLF